MSVYRPTRPYERSPLQRRASGLALAVGVNIALILMLLTLGRFAPETRKVGDALVVDLLPESHSAGTPEKKETAHREGGATGAAAKLEAQASDRNPVQTHHHRSAALTGASAKP